MQPSAPPWRRTTLSPRSSSPKPQMFLQHTMSMSNLHDQPAWTWPMSPPSPTSSTTSSVSRNTTPTNTNPWASAATSPISPQRSSPGSRSPYSTSRCATPVAPQPRKPEFSASASISRMSNNIQTAERLKSPEVPKFSSSTPNPFQRTAEPVPNFDTTSPIMTPTILHYNTRLFPTLLHVQPWDISKKQSVCCWAVSNQKTAMLLYLCENDFMPWRRAEFWDLKDSKLPFVESDLNRIVSEPKKVIESQWRVMAKELPQNGQHTEYMNAEVVPLKQVSVITPMGSDMKSVDRVRWLGDHGEKIFVRKRFTYTKHAQKLAILSEIEKFKKYDHPNIGKLLCSYSQGSTVAFLSTSAQWNLEDYLKQPLNSINPQLLLSSINDLTQALTFLHTREIAHKSIRPQKILIDGHRIYISAFGISAEGQTASPRSIGSVGYPTTRTFTDHSYTYAAPETVSRRKLGRRADVFSLGCVFLSIMTVVKLDSLDKFLAYRSADSNDMSFHANLDRVNTYIKQLRAKPGAARQQRQMMGENKVLDYVSTMIELNPSSRSTMRKLSPYVREWWERIRGAGNGRTFDALDAAGKWISSVPTAEITVSYSNP